LKIRSPFAVRASQFVYFLIRNDQRSAQLRNLLTLIRDLFIEI